MTIATRISTAVVALLAGTFVATHANALPAERTAAPVDTSAERSVPAGYLRVVDETGTITAAVPEDWFVETEPVLMGDDLLHPAISARPEPGTLPLLDIWISAPEVVEQPTDECGDPIGEPYDDGRFGGYRIRNAGCDASLDEIVASDGNITVHLAFVWSSVDGVPVLERDAATAVLDTVLATLEWTGKPYETPDPAVWADAVELPPTLLSDDGSMWPFGPFRNVPQLGEEPVRGSLCGSGGDVGDLIPDGLVAGLVRDWRLDDSTIDIDLLCVYHGSSVEFVPASANVINDAPDYYVVNNSMRTRGMRLAPGAVFRTTLPADGGCVEDIGSFPDRSPDADDHHAWVRINHGLVTFVMWDCEPLG